jgi:hypothetical protein
MDQGDDVRVAVVRDRGQNLGLSAKMCGVENARFHSDWCPVKLCPIDCTKRSRANAIDQPDVNTTDPGI